MRPGSRRRLAAALIAEAWQAMIQRPMRLTLTALGIVIGIGSLVATIGLTATASAQIGSEFNALLAVQVGVGPTSGTGLFPPDAAQRVDALAGVRTAGIWSDVDDNAQIATSRTGLLAQPQTARLIAAGAGYLEADETKVTGVPLGAEFSAAPVAVIGLGCARSLGLGKATVPYSLLLAGRVVTVVGVIDSSPVDPTLLDSIVVPLQAAAAYWSTSSMSAQKMVVLTRPGAAQVVAAEVATAADPLAPGKFTAAAPPDPTQLRDQVQGNVGNLFVSLALVALVVSGFGIANMTLVSVMERQAEIGVRRAVGARRMHIAAQFVLESGLTGLIGGVIGTAVGIMVVVGVSFWKTWTATLPNGLPIAASLLGLAVGILAGIYPSLRAASLQPVDALRSQ